MNEMSKLRDKREELGITYREGAEAIRGNIGNIQVYEKASKAHRRFLKYCLFIASRDKMTSRVFKDFIEELAEEEREE